MIKCPECGHAISDKAPFCPSCGVPIAGKTTTASNDNPSAQPQGDGKRKKKQDSGSNKAIIIVSLAFAIIVCGVCFYFYGNAKNGKEQEAYEYAMTSKDLTVLNGYLDTYPDAPQEHRDSIQSHITLLEQTDADWTNALVSGSRSAIEQYLRKYPDSPHKADALHKLDSLDWTRADQANTMEAVEEYLKQHPDGYYYDNANDKLKTLSSTTVQPEDRQLISSIFATFLQSLNNKDEDALTSTVNTLLTSFLGKPNATRSDVVTFMHKIYKSTVERMNWTSLGDYKVSKEQTADGGMQYGVTFTATQQVENTDETSTLTKYRINAKVTVDGRISEMSMTKILE